MAPNHSQNALRSGILALCLCGTAAFADGISSFGTPGLLDMPSATTTPDGTFTFTTAALPKEYRNTLHFQITPRLSGVFRYSILQDYFSSKP